MATPVSSQTPNSQVKSIVFLANAFSVNMLSQLPAVVKFEEISLEEAKRILANGFESAVGHQGTSQLLSQLLGIQVPTVRRELKLSKGQTVIIFQLLVRLQEGQVLSAEEVQKLYSEGKVKFIKATVE